MTTKAMRKAAKLRAQGGRYSSRVARPAERRMPDCDAKMANRVVVPSSLVRQSTDDPTSDGPVVYGFASRTEVGYEMFDFAGPYTETVSLDAFDVTLAASPSVEFVLNHARAGGAPMAHTRNGTLTLSVVKDGEETGLAYEASVDPERTDVADMLKAIQRGDLAEASFKFRIVRGQWSPDYMEYRITEVDIHRGDVSAVNFGANPTATSGVRSTPQISSSRARIVIPDHYTTSRHPR